MKASDAAVIFNFHQKVIAEYGIGTVDALGWVSEASQRARFAVFAGLADYTGCSVLDVGCGHADLRNYLAERYPNVHYTGIEQIPALLNVAIKRYGDLPDTLFLKGDFSELELPAADFIIACGALSYRNSDPMYIYQIIKKLFSHARIGFAFNFLSYLTYPDAAIASYDPALLKNYCHTLTTNVTCVDGYWEHDHTLLLLH